MAEETDKLFDGEIFQTVFLLSRTKHLKIYIANKYRILKIIPPNLPKQSSATAVISESVFGLDITNLHNAR